MRMLVVITVLIFISGQPLNSEIVLSEILSNEPSNRVLLEWLEVYNNGSEQIDMFNYKLVENEDTLTFPEGSLISSYSYAVLCRRLEPLNGSDCFEYHWGDSSGVWGDAVGEDYVVYKVGISLLNSGGGILLLTDDSQVVDQYTWNQPSDDGRSAERDDVTDPLSSWHACYDPTGSTPGKENSRKPADNQNYIFEVNPQLRSLSGADRIITISYSAPTGGRISLIVYDDTARRRATILEDTDLSFNVITWNLVGDGNRLLSPGLYFISFKAEGTNNVQKYIPVVIAP